MQVPPPPLEAMGDREDLCAGPKWRAPRGMEAEVKTTAVSIKITDSALRQFVEQRADGEMSVLIELDLPSPLVTISKSECLGRSSPQSVAVPGDYAKAEREAIEQVETRLGDMGLRASYLRASRTFLAEVSSEQLMQLLNLKKVRSVALNRSVRAFG